AADGRRGRRVPHGRRGRHARRHAGSAARAPCGGAGPGRDPRPAPAHGGASAGGAVGAGRPPSSRTARSLTRSPRDGAGARRSPKPPVPCLPAPAHPTLRPAPSIPTPGLWRPTMATRRRSPAALVAVLAVAALAACAAQGVRPEADDIAGVVTGPNGPEAGVWVIAETEDLPTRFARIVVTDDDGRYLLPDLPDARYRVWVRGYGLVDGPAVDAAPGSTVDLTATPAPDALAAAQYYPAGYWFSLLRVPDASEFPGTGPRPEGNGIAPGMRNQAQWLRLLKNGNCLACHQLGNKATREIPPELGTFESTVAAWDRRVQSGQAGAWMSGGLNAFGRERVL